MDVKTRWNSTYKLLERANRIQELTCKSLKNPIFSDCRPLFTTQEQWTIIKSIMEVLRQFRYCTLWVLKWHKVTLHPVSSVNNNTFDHMDGVICSFAKKKTQWTEQSHWVVKFAQQKLPKYYYYAAPTTGLRRISTHILDPFPTL
jgi:hypothetical protein